MSHRNENWYGVPPSSTLDLIHIPPDTRSQGRDDRRRQRNLRVTTTEESGAVWVRGRRGKTRPGTCRPRVPDSVERHKTNQDGSVSESSSGVNTLLTPVPPSRPQSQRVGSKVREGHDCVQRTRGDVSRVEDSPR